MTDKLKVPRAVKLVFDTVAGIIDEFRRVLSPVPVPHQQGSRPAPSHIDTPC